jgi:hypothetical protein
MWCLFKKDGYLVLTVRIPGLCDSEVVVKARQLLAAHKDEFDGVEIWDCGCFASESVPEHPLSAMAKEADVSLFDITQSFVDAEMGR